MVNFCHISPTKYLQTFCKNQTHHLILAHLIESDPEYTRWYKNLKESRNYYDTKLVYIMDNGGFEFFKAGLPMYPSDLLIEMGRKVKANYIVMSDYPNQHSSVTIKAAEKLAPQFKQARFGTFFVPQSEIGDIEDYISCFAWAASSPLVDYIGVSILGVPNAYGVEKGNNLQRFMSRYMMMSELESRGILYMAQMNGKKIHFLGMVDGPNEILLTKKFHIDTWDSSAAVWLGLNGMEFDDSPTGLINGKYEKEVDFNFNEENSANLLLAQSNINYIEKLIVGNSLKVNPIR